MFEKLKSFLSNTTLFYSVLLGMVAVSSFSLGRLSAEPEVSGTSVEKQGSISITPPAQETQLAAPPAVVPEELKPVVDDVTVTVVASKSGSKYHLPSCPGAKQIKPENLITFASPSAAEAAGYTAAANCPGLE